MPHAPFTAHFRIVPKRGLGRRFDLVRELERLAVLAYEAVKDVAGLTVAIPGGGQDRNTVRNENKFGNIADGMGVKPQFGETPAQLMITGFYEVNDSNPQPHPDATVFHANSSVSGVYGAHPWLPGGNPTSLVEGQVKALKELFETAFTADLPADVTISMFRLDYKGVIWGDRGHSFPR